MRIVWTTDPGADPRSSRVFTGVQADAVAATAVGGVPVLVTATEGHYDGDCARPHTHDCAAMMLQVWDAATGELIRTVPDVGGTHLVTTVVGDTAVAVVCDWSDTPTLIDLDAGAVLGRPAGHRDIVQGLATVPFKDGPALVSVGWDGDLRVVRPAGGEATVIKTGERLHAVSAATVDGRAIAVVAGEDVGLWDLERGVRIGTLSAVSRVRKIAGWPDGNALVALLTWSGEVEVWDLTSGERLACGLTGRPMSPDIAGVVTGDGRRLLALSDPEAVHLWDVDTDRPVGPPIVGPTGWCALSTAGPGTLVTASGPDEAVAVWQVTTDVPQPGSGHTSTITCLALGPDDRVIAGGTDGTVGSWRLTDRGRGPVVGTLPAPVRAVAAAPGLVVAGGGDLHETPDDSLHRWADDGTDQPVVVDHRGEVRIVVTSVLDGRPIALTAGCDATLRITDLGTGEDLGGIPGEHQPDGIAVLGEGPVVAVSRTFGPFQLWDLARGVPIDTPLTDAMDVSERVRAFAGLGEGPALITVRHHRVRARDLATGLARDLDPGNEEAVTALAVRDLGGPAAAVARADGSLSLVDLAAGTVTDELALPYSASALLWTPDGDLIVACCRDLLRISR